MVKVEAVFDTVSPYMGSGPEVDAAWDRLTWNSTCMCSIQVQFCITLLMPTLLSVELIRLSDEDLKKLHKDGRPSNVRLSEEHGGGSLGTVNVIHLLHCVVRTLFSLLNATLISEQCKGFRQEIRIFWRLPKSTGVAKGKTSFHEISHRCTFVPAILRVVLE
jgi:hypothetical protein